jgi:hypothetical protein
VHGQSARIGPRCRPSALTPSVLEGASVRVIEEDDGSGWVKVVDEDGGRGLVPASYIESAGVTQADSPGSGPSLGSGQFGEWPHHFGWFPGFLLSEVRGLYEYQSQGADELAVSEGARIELTSGPSGGKNYADGWWEGQQQRTPASRRAILI